MTNAEAIEVLRANYPDACYEQLREAVDMAIEALKAQLFHDGTTSDLISRQQTLNALMDAVKSVGILDADDIKAVFDMLPSAQPEPQEGHWIEVAGELECSECHTVFTDLYPDYADSVACPHCGAKMKGAQDE